MEKKLRFAAAVARAHIYIIKTLAANINVIKEMSFGNLQNAVENGIVQRKLCNICSANVTSSIHTNVNIYVDTSDCGSTTLNQFSRTMKLFGKNYILRAVLNFIPPHSENGIGHYNCFTKRLDSRWELFDDMDKNYTPVNNETIVLPHLLLYSL